MADLFTRVERFVRRYGLLPRGSRVLVAVSGGPDSLSLLLALRWLAVRRELTLHVAHLNHGLRGSAAEGDARFVAELAASWNLPCTVGRANVGALAARPGVSVEEAARLARYNFLRQVARENRIGLVAVGHTLDDQAETVLMHFLRGSGTAGLRGMLPRVPLPGDWLCDPDGMSSGLEPPEADARPVDTAIVEVVRPLLQVTREETEACCAEHGLEPRRDLSNDDTTIYRNRLRHELLPMLAQYNPMIRSVLARTAEVMEGDHAVLATQREAAWQSVYAGGGTDEVWFHLGAWRSLPLGLQRAVLREGVWRLRRSLRNVGWDHIERAVWLAREGSTGQAADLTGGLSLEIGYDRLRLARGGTAWKASSETPRVTEALNLIVPGVTPLPAGWRVTVRQLGGDDWSVGTGGSWRAVLDASAVGERLVLRPRRPGDRFRPQGLGGHSVALSEFLIDAKVPRAERDAWPLLEGACGVAWVCGIRVAEPAIVSSETTVVWEVKFDR